MTQEKKEQVIQLMRFIDNYEGELTIKKHEIYDGHVLVATFNGNKAYLVHKVV